MTGWNDESEASLLSRRHLLRRAGAGAGALSLGGLVAACGGASAKTASTAAQTAQAAASSGLTHVTDQLGWIKISQFEGFFAAQEKGYFKKQGIDANVRAGGPNIIASQVVASGGALVGDDDNGTVLQAIAKGEPLIIYGAIFQKSPYACMSLPSKPIRTLKDFKGKTIALTAATRPELTPLLKAAGVDPSSVKFVPSGPDPSQLVNHQVDGYFGYPTAQGVALQEQGIKFVTAYLNDLGLPSYGNVLITKPDTVKKEKDTLVHYLRAVIMGWEYSLAHPMEMGQLVAKKYGPPGLKVKGEQLTSKAQIPLIKSPKGVMWVTKAKMQKVIESYYKTGGIDKKLNVDKVMTTSILEAAYNGRKSLLH